MAIDANFAGIINSIFAATGKPVHIHVYMNRQEIDALARECFTLWPEGIKLTCLNFQNGSVTIKDIEQL